LLFLTAPQKAAAANPPGASGLARWRDRDRHGAVMPGERVLFQMKKRGHFFHETGIMSRNHDFFDVKECREHAIATGTV
jgi:hypothetical protein